MSVSDELGFFRELGVTNIGAISPKLETIGWDPAVFADAGLRVSNIGTEERVLGEALDFGAAVGTDSVWCTTGSIGSRTWEDAADEFCERIAPAAARANELGVRARDRADQPVAHRHQLRVQPPRLVGARPLRRDRRRARAGVLLVRTRTGRARARERRHVGARPGLRLRDRNVRHAESFGDRRWRRSVGASHRDGVGRRLRRLVRPGDHRPQDRSGGLLVGDPPQSRADDGDARPASARDAIHDDRCAITPAGFRARRWRPPPTFATSPTATRRSRSTSAAARHRR